MVNFASLFRLISFTWYRYPCYSINEIQGLIRKHSPSEDDKEQLLFFSHARWTKWHHLSILIAIIFWIFQTSIAVYLIFSNDYLHAEKNLKYLPDEVVKFKCLYTNCTRFFNQNETTTQNLAEDLLRLPFFKICHPIMRKFTYPFVDFGFDSYIYVQILGYAMFVYGIVGQVAQALDPVGDVTILFAVAPELALKMFLNLMRSYYVELLASMFKFNNKRVRYKIERRLSRLNEQDCYNCVKLQSLLQFDKHWENKTEFEDLIKAKYEDKSYFNGTDDDPYVDQFIHDCLPLIRTKWWRERILYTYKIIVAYIFPYLLINTLGSALFYLYDRRIKQNEVYSQITRKIHESNCAIWTINSKGRKIQIDSEVWTVISPNYIITIQHIHLSITAISVVLTCFVGAYINHSELLSLIREISSQMAIIIELTNIEMRNIRSTQIDSAKSMADIVSSKSHGEELNLFPNLEGSSSSSLLNRRKKRLLSSQKMKQFKLCMLRNLLKLAHSNKRYVATIGDLCFTSTGSYTDNIIYNQRIAYEIRCQYDDHFNTICKILEKIYIKIRLLLDIRHHYGRSMSVQLFYLSFTAYAYTFSSLIFLRQVPNTYIRIGLVLTNFLYFAICLFASQSINLFVSILVHYVICNRILIHNILNY